MKQAFLLVSAPLFLGRAAWNATLQWIAQAGDPTRQLRSSPTESPAWCETSAYGRCQKAMAPSASTSARYRLSRSCAASAPGYSPGWLKKLPGMKTWREFGDWYSTLTEF